MDKRKTPGPRKGRFESSGVGLKYGQPSITVRFPPEIDVLLRSLPDRTDYIRKTVVKQLKEDGLLPDDQGSDRTEAEKAAQVREAITARVRDRIPAMTDNIEQPNHDSDRGAA